MFSQKNQFNLFLSKFINHTSYLKGFNPDQLHNLNQWRIKPHSDIFTFFVDLQLTEFQALSSQQKIAWRAQCRTWREKQDNWDANRLYLRELSKPIIEILHFVNLFRNPSVRNDAALQLKQLKNNLACRYLYFGTLNIFYSTIVSFDLTKLELEKINKIVSEIDKELDLFSYEQFTELRKKYEPKEKSDGEDCKFTILLNDTKQDSPTSPAKVDFRVKF